MVYYTGSFMDCFVKKKQTIGFDDNMEDRIGFLASL